MNPVDFSITEWVPWMQRALQLASLADGETSPNPLVGALVLDARGTLVGEGFHSKAGMPHAEVNALVQAGERARGGTLVVTLEPVVMKDEHLLALRQYSDRDWPELLLH